MKLSNNMKTALIAVLASLGTIFGIKAVGTFTGKGDIALLEAPGSAGTSMVSFANLPAGKPGDFTYAAEVSTPSVVHIKATTTRTQRRSNSIFEQFFGFDDEMFGQPRSQNQESSGSGVIISNDGYIVTNNHVVEGTSSLEVITHDKKVYAAEIVGRDPSTDIAVIKIQEKGLPAITFGNSDEARIGEWVLAVGNPFNLESTVTAGIISAIGRNINILGRRQQQQNPFGRQQQQQTNAEPINAIESFIQTDAAINPGNSGGALVNLNGHLIGINTAIASPNGAYAGYAFAVPAGIVKKVSTDLIKYGDVQRGYVGVRTVELNSKVSKELNVKAQSGIYVGEVVEGGAADAAGMKKGDVIVKADGIDTKSQAKFLELIGRKRPGEKVAFVVDRDGKERNVSVTLKNEKGGSDIIKRDPSSTTAFGKMGVTLENIDAKELSNLGLRNGVKIKEISEGGLFSTYTELQKGFVITIVGNTAVKSAKEVEQLVNQALQNGEEGVLVCGYYPGSTRRTCEGIPLQ